jgi:hypothetical protein
LENSQIGKKFLVILIMIALVATLSLLIILNPDKQLDSQTGCPAVSGSQAKSVSILLDASDPYAASQVKHVSNFIRAYVDELEAFDRIKIYQVDESFSLNLHPIFDFCKPGSDLNKTPLDAVLMEKKFDTNLESIFQSIQGQRVTSPIIQAISSVASDFDQSIPNRSIVLVSDLIEYSSLANMYETNWAKSIEDNQAKLQKAKPILDGVDLTILLLMRPNLKIQDKTIRDWWVDYLELSGARILTVKAITG